MFKKKFFHFNIWQIFFRAHGGWLAALLLMFAVTSFLVFSCNNNDLEAPACTVNMSYDAETTELLRPYNMADTARMSDVDRAFTMPRRYRELVSVCLQSDGSYIISVENLNPKNSLNVPTGATKVWLDRDYHRYVNNSGVITYYNAVGDVLRTDVTSNLNTDILDLVNIFLDIRNGPTITDVQFNSFLDSLSAYGLPIIHHDSKIATTRVNHTDGSYSIGIIDKHSRMQTGQINYNADGSLSSYHIFKVDGVAPSVILKELIRVYPMEAIDSKVRLQHITATKFYNFTLNLN